MKIYKCQCGFEIKRIGSDTCPGCGSKMTVEFGGDIYTRYVDMEERIGYTIKGEV